MTEMTRLPVARLERIVTAIFAGGGLNELQAQAVARVITAGERDACKSHGIYRIDGCLRTVAAGKVNPAANPVLRDQGGAVIRVDAQGGFSPAAFALGLPILVERARAQGLAALIINDCTHFSALWPEVEALTEYGLAALAMCPSYATVAPCGGKAPTLGTNPLAFGWPRRNHPPYVFDFATSAAARGEIELHQRNGTPLPEGWAIDSDGQPTTEPDRALQGAMLPFGVHKGSAIATMIELLAGTLIGDLTSRDALDYLGTTALLPRHGELILAFDPQHFSAGRDGDPLERAELLFSAIVGQGARLPSQRRFAARAEAQSEGIPLSPAEIAMLEKLCGCVLVE